MNSFLSIMDFLSFDAAKMISWSCLAKTTFYEELLVMTLGPLVICALLFLIYKIHNYFSKRNDLGDCYMQIFFALSFVMFSSVSTKVFQIFPCETFDDGTQFLKADYSVSCTTETYQRFYSYAIFMLLIYPFGIPLLYSVSLYRNRHEIVSLKTREEMEETREGMSAIDRINSLQSIRAKEKASGISYLEFLFEPYSADCWWFSVWECARRLMLSGLLVFFDDNSTTQLVVAVLVSVFWLCVFLRQPPFKDEEDNYLEQFIEVMIFITLFAVLLVGVEVSDSESTNMYNVGIFLVAMDCAVLLFGLSFFVLYYVGPKIYNSPKNAKYISNKFRFCANRIRKRCL